MDYDLMPTEGPEVCSGLAEYLRDSSISLDVFRQYLKTFSFARY